jgi:ABC-type antimicrobial peptide transport system permease subunit
VVGIVSDERVGGLDNDEPEPIVYVSQEQSPQMVSQILVVRGEIPPALLEKHVRAAIRSVNPDQVLSDVRPLQQLRRELLAPRHFQTGLLVGFAAVALLLATLGIYGVLAHTVQQRTRELGIRSALGASGRQLVRHVLGRGMLLVGTGLALGVVAFLAASQMMSAFVYGVAESDPLSLGSGVVLLTSVAWVACYLPARRAAKVDPIICLRCE